MHCVTLHWILYQEKEESCYYGHYWEVDKIGMWNKKIQ